MSPLKLLDFPPYLEVDPNLFFAAFQRSHMGESLLETCKTLFHLEDDIN